MHIGVDCSAAGVEYAAETAAYNLPPIGKQIATMPYWISVWLTSSRSLFPENNQRWHTSAPATQGCAVISPTAVGPALHFCVPTGEDCGSQSEHPQGVGSARPWTKASTFSPV